MTGMLVELPLLGVGGEAVEVIEQVERHPGIGAAELVDHGKRVDLLSGVQRCSRKVMGAIVSGGVALAVPGQPGYRLSSAVGGGLLDGKTGVGSGHGELLGLALFVVHERRGLSGGLIHPRCPLVPVRARRASWARGSSSHYVAPCSRAPLMAKSSWKRTELASSTTP